MPELLCHNSASLSLRQAGGSLASEAGRLLCKWELGNFAAKFDEEQPLGQRILSLLDASDLLKLELKMDKRRDYHLKIGFRVKGLHITYTGTTKRT